MASRDETKVVDGSHALVIILCSVREHRTIVGPNHFHLNLRRRTSLFWEVGIEDVGIMRRGHGILARVEQFSKVDVYARSGASRRNAILHLEGDGQVTEEIVHRGHTGRRPRPRNLSLTQQVGGRECTKEWIGTETHVVDDARVEEDRQSTCRHRTRVSLMIVHPHFKVFVVIDGIGGRGEDRSLHWRHRRRP